MEVQIMSNIFLTGCALTIVILITIMLTIKKSVNNEETKIFKKMLICNILESLVTTTIVIVALIWDQTFILELLNRIDVILIVTWCSLMFSYIYYISKSKPIQSIKKRLWVFNSIVFLLALFLPVKIINSNGIMDSTGPLTYFGFVMAILYIAMMLYALLTSSKEKKKLNKNKYIPFYFLIGLLIAVAILRLIVPSINFISILLSLIDLIMIFTIENPDLKMIDALNSAKNQAEKANQAKTDFLSSMSHEIRTPLNAIVGFSSCIEDAKTLEEAKENAKDVITASNTLLEIVNGILDISKIEAGKMEITNASYLAYDVFNELGKLMRPRATEKGLDLQIHVAEDIPATLYGDASNVKKVITNILSNAVKYTKKGYVKYDVSCVKNGDVCRIIVSVEDTGRGIKPENIDKLFNKFERLDEDRNTTVEGTGLGLAITKQLVEMMGGKIIVQSVFGSGSKFTIILNQKIVSEKERVSVVNEIEKNVATLLGKRILVVDDNTLNLKVAGKILEKYNPKEIINVSSGFECIDKIKSGEQFDLILMDDMMPKMSGTETLAKLKQIEGFHTPVVALTANAITGMREKYLAAGFNDYLSKPIEKQPLETLLSSIFKKVETPSSISNGQSLFGDLPPSIYEIGSNNKLDIAQPSDLKSSCEIPPVTENTKDLTNELLATEETKKSRLKQLTDAKIDVSKGVEFLGDMDTYNDTAKDFIQNLEARIEKLKQLKDQNDMTNYAIEVHALKSDAKYLGCKNLSEIAFEQEVKSKSNDVNFIITDFSRLEKECERILSIFQKYLETIR